MNAAGDEYLRGTRALLLRANLQKHNFVQTAGPPPEVPPPAAVAAAAAAARLPLVAPPASLLCLRDLAAHAADPKICAGLHCHIISMYMYILV